MSSPLAREFAVGHDGATRHGQRSSSPSDEDFYFSDGNVYLQVEGRIFKVHRYFFNRESIAFRDLFCWIQAHDTTGAGLSTRNPIQLSDTTEAQLVSVLNYFYYGMRQDFGLDKEMWIHLLEFSSRFVCPELRKTAVAKLTHLKYCGLLGISVINQLHMAVKHDMEDWYEDAYEKIVMDDKPVSTEDIKRLPLVIVVLLLRSRELYHHRDNWHSHGLFPCGGVTPRCSALDIVRTVSELLEIGYTGPKFMPSTHIVGRWLQLDEEYSDDLPVVAVL